MRRTLTAVIAAMALCGLWPQLATAQAVPPPSLSATDPALLLGPMVVLGLALWVSSLWLWRQNRNRVSGPSRTPAVLAVFALVLTVAFAYMYGYAVAAGTAVPLAALIGVPSPQAFLTAFLMFVTAYFLYLVVIETRHEAPHIDTHWGGFGGGLGGWTISRAIIYLIVAVVFGTLMMGHALWRGADRGSPASQNASPSTPRPSPTPSSSSSTAKPADPNAAKPEAEK